MMASFLIRLSSSVNFGVSIELLTVWAICPCSSFDIFALQRLCHPHICVFFSVDPFFIRSPCILLGILLNGSPALELFGTLN